MVCACVKRSMYVMHRFGASCRRIVGTRQSSFARKYRSPITIDHLQIATIWIWCHDGDHYKHTDQRRKPWHTVDRLAQYMWSRCTFESCPGESSTPPHPKGKNKLIPRRCKRELKPTPQTGRLRYHTGRSLGCGMSSYITQRSRGEKALVGCGRKFTDGD